MSDNDEQYIAHYNLKQQAIETILGPSADVIGHAIIPFRVIAGMTLGAVDMHYFPNHVEGTGFTTMELIQTDGTGPVPNTNGTYELIAFTKQAFNDIDQDPPTAFNMMERRVCENFTQIAGAAQKKAFNPYEICQISGSDGKPRYILFDMYREFEVEGHKHHLLLCMEIFEEELTAVANFGHQGFLEMLKMIKIYPYSDMDRNWVGMRK